MYFYSVKLSVVHLTQILIKFTYKAKQLLIKYTYFYKRK